MKIFLRISVNWKTVPTLIHCSAVTYSLTLIGIWVFAISDLIQSFSGFSLRFCYRKNNKETCEISEKVVLKNIQKKNNESLEVTIWVFDLFLDAKIGINQEQFRIMHVSIEFWTGEFDIVWIIVFAPDLKFNTRDCSRSLYWNLSGDFCSDFSEIQFLIFFRRTRDHCVTFLSIC